MAKPIRVYTKKARADAPGTMVGVRLQPDQLAAVDAWIEATADPVCGRATRPEAIRRLIDNALGAEKWRVGKDA